VRLGEGDLMLCKSCDKARFQQLLDAKSSVSAANTVNPVDMS